MNIFDDIVTSGSSISDRDDKILKEAMRYDSKEKQLKVLLYRHLGYSKPEGKELQLCEKVNAVFEGMFNDDMGQCSRN